MKLTIDVTQHDITTGTCADPVYCAMAWAATRAVREILGAGAPDTWVRVSAFNMRVMMWDSARYRMREVMAIPLTKRQFNFVNRFDRRDILGVPKPQRFTVRIPT